MKIDIDLRKKGCPNPNCPMHQRRVKQGVDVKYCPECGTKLVFVCAKCFKEIEDKGPKHRICLHCEADAEEKRAKAVGQVKDVAGKAAQAVGVVAAGAAMKVVREQGVKMVDVVVKNGGKVLGSVAKAVIHK